MPLQRALPRVPELEAAPAPMQQLLVEAPVQWQKPHPQAAQRAAMQQFAARHPAMHKRERSAELRRAAKRSLGLCLVVLLLHLQLLLADKLQLAVPTSAQLSLPMASLQAGPLPMAGHLQQAEMLQLAALTPPAVEQRLRLLAATACMHLPEKRGPAALMLLAWRQRQLQAACVQ